MRIDRTTKALLTVIAAALAAIALNPWLPAPGWRDAVRPGPAEAQGVRTISVPKDWGRAAGFIPGYAYLEAADGTIRLVSISTNEPVGGAVLVITRR
jgi:hypothetical protein